jgi:hypothetical protein
MLGASGLVAVTVLTTGIGVSDIARIAQQQGPLSDAWGRATFIQAWAPQPFAEDPADRETLPLKPACCRRRLAA